ncbi:GAT domain protein [Trichuris suis]|nr:GAT domain protein [Trichuris suis]
MLSELQPGQEDPDDLRVLKDLNDVCREMQRRIIGLIQQISNDAVTSELLIINDELNTVFAKYDRYMTNRESASQSTAGKSHKVEVDEDTALIDLSDDLPAAAGTGDTSNPVVEFVGGAQTDRRTQADASSPASIHPEGIGNVLQSDGPLPKQNSST